jgi:hypothetical protein
MLVIRFIAAIASHIDTGYLLRVRISMLSQAGATLGARNGLSPNWSPSVR